MYIFIGLVIILLPIAFYFKEAKTVIDIVGNTIVEVEKACNTKQGQDKLELAVIKIRERLPRYLSMFITKSMLVSIIEFLLNILNKAFDINHTVNIKGNDLKLDLDLTSQDKKSMGFSYEVVNEKDFTIYGKVKGETDFKGKNNATIEIGFQKRF